MRAVLIGLIAISFAKPAEQICFDAASNRNLTFGVIQQAPPPLNGDDAHYLYYPLTAAASMDLAHLNQSRADSIDLYYFLWANRRDSGWNKKGNVVHPRLMMREQEVRTFFTNFQRANDCTLAQAARLLGFSPGVIDGYGRRAGFTIVPKGPEAISRQRDGKLTDICLVEKEPLTARASGVVLDYEVQDGRTPEETLAFLTEFAALVHKKGKKAILYSNPLDAPTQRYTSVAASNAHQIYEAFDRTGILLWHGNRQGDIAKSYQAQLQILREGGKVDPKRLLPIFELNQTTLAETETVRKLVQSEGMPGVILWRNYAKAGGDCGTDPNRKIGCLVFGKCH